MMGGKSSNNKGGDSPPQAPSQPVQAINNSQFTADLSFYEDACKLDMDLQNFDTTIHGRTNFVISSLANGVEVRSKSLDSLKEVTNALLEMNQEVVKVALDSKKDIRNNQELFDLVEEYFESSIRSLDFCTALEGCLKRVQNCQLIIQVAIKQFEEEFELLDGVVEKKYVKTLEDLQKFKAAGDPFGEEFFVLFQSLYKQQVSMLEKLQLRKRKLDKKFKSMKTWRKVSSVLFIATFVAVLIFSVLAAARPAPPVVIALASALTGSMGSVGSWCNSLWNNYEKEMKGQRKLVSSMLVGTFITIKDMDGIRVLVNKLEVEMESFLHNVDFTLKEEGAVKIVIDLIKKKVEVFVATIEDLGEHADKCSRDIRQARTVILQRIIKYPEN